MKVRCINNENAKRDLTIGRVYEVLQREVERTEERYLINNDKNEECSYFKNRFRAVKGTGKGDENMKFKVGDRVEVIDNRRSETYFDVGDNGEIIEIIHLRDGIRVKFDIPKRYDGVWMVASDQIKRINSMKFKVVDKVRAIDNHYRITALKNKWVGEVIEVYCDTGIRVKTINFIGDTRELTKEHKVIARHFELVEEPTEFTFQEVIARNIPGVYVNCSHPSARLKKIEIQQSGRIVLHGTLIDGTGIRSDAKFKLQEPKKRITIYKVEHKQDGKKYDFISSQRLQEEIFVVCDTSQGKSYGRVVGSEDKELTEAEIKQYKECWKA